MDTTTWKISYPEKFIAEIEHYPAVQHNHQSQQIQAHTQDLRTTFQYEKIEEGCYLFVVDMEALEATKIAILGDREVEYFCLSYQLIRGGVNKTPHKDNYQQSKALSLPRICSFYNNAFDYETNFEEKAGIRAFIFCFKKEWLMQHIDLSSVDYQAGFMKVLAKEMDGIAYFNDSFYKDTYDELNHVLSSHKRSPVYSLVVKKLSMALIADFFSIVTDPLSVLNVPAQPEEFDGIENIKDYIHNHFRKGFPGLDYLAELGKMTVPTMRRQFKRQTGKTAFDYFREVQMRCAFEMLQQGHRVKQVAYLLNFSNASNFSRTFKEVYRLPPAAVMKLIDE
ncbi:helix-turn-helix domain-containing protein [Pedobacter glucosidilyticus]|uniref:helix-turn-helix domain-containing protein n=1 Tax=Pedobacter glucosidilyticus TaxID=1122941 RepID=UPI0026EDEE6C|nr:AraC family transcriptional regulator [Pedobacter glucosidilyticus]